MSQYEPINVPLGVIRQLHLLSQSVDAPVTVDRAERVSRAEDHYRWATDDEATHDALRRHALTAIAAAIAIMIIVQLAIAALAGRL